MKRVLTVYIEDDCELSVLAFIATQKRGEVCSLHKIIENVGGEILSIQLPFNDDEIIERTADPIYRTL